MTFFFQKKNKNSNDLSDVFETACEGLVYISETDAPILPFAGGPADTVTGQIILQQTGGEPQTQVEEIEFDTFFTKLTTIKDWYGEPEKARAERFLDLKMLLEENLRELKVFRIGNIRLDIYVVGIDIEGNLMGVTTIAVET